MPANKDFKRLIRARMQKTGEAYTTARAHLLKRPVAAPPDYAKLAGLSDAAVEKRTGRAWENWVRVLDAAGAATWPHRVIAGHVRIRYGVPAWWTQAVTVGYERIKGLREIGQRRDGGYEVTKSKTIHAPARAVFRALAEARGRRTWLPGVTAVVRTLAPGRSVRMSWDDGTSVEMSLTEKDPRKTVAHVHHRKLASREDADRRRRYWDERLSALRTIVERRPGRRSGRLSS